MPDLMISSTPTPPPGGAGNANALSQNDATSRSGDGAKTNAESGTEAPFAAVLKSRMDKKAPDADKVDNPNASAAKVETDTENSAVSADLSAFFPLLGVTVAAVAGMVPVPVTSARPMSLAATEPASADSAKKALPGIHASAEEGLPQNIIALPAAPTTAVMAVGTPKQNAETRDETLATAFAETESTAPASGKIALDAAITADTGRTSTDNNASELPGGDFHVLMERAAAAAPGATSPANVASSSPNLRIDTPLGQTGWHDEMGQKLTWMLGNNQQRADLVLTPPHLGRVEVSLTMIGDQAAATFTSANPAVREALENSLHRLRDVLADAGINLGQTHVGSESPHQSPSRSERDFGVNQGQRYASNAPVPAAATGARTGAGRSMIDIFA